MSDTGTYIFVVIGILFFSVFLSECSGSDGEYIPPCADVETEYGPSGQYISDIDYSNCEDEETEAEEDTQWEEDYESELYESSNPFHDDNLNNPTFEGEMP